MTLVQLTQVFSGCWLLVSGYLLPTYAKQQLRWVNLFLVAACPPKPWRRRGCWFLISDLWPL